MFPCAPVAADAYSVSVFKTGIKNRDRREARGDVVSESLLWRGHTG